MTAKSITDILRRFFFMKERIAEADQLVTASGSKGVIHARAGRLLLAAAESFDNEAERQLGAIVMLRDAIVVAAQGVAERRQLAEREADVASVWNAAVELPGLKTVLQAFSAETRERIDCIVSTGFTAEYGAWSGAELSALKQSLLTVTRWLVVDLEAEVLAPKRLRMVRLWRWAGAALVLSLVTGYGIKRVQRYLIPRPTNDGTINVALNKTVELSSNWRTDIYPPDRLTDGDATQLGCHSSSEPNPWAIIDLGRVYNIHRVIVTNRLEGLMEHAVPLRIELSIDGSDFTDYAKRDEVFTTWTAKGKRAMARYVRLSVARTSILHLNEVEVY